MKTSLCTGEPRHGTESARRENRAAKGTDKNTGQDRETLRQKERQSNKEGQRGQEEERYVLSQFVSACLFLLVQHLCVACVRVCVCVREHVCLRQCHPRMAGHESVF